MMLVFLWRIKDIFLSKVTWGLRPRFPKRVSQTKELEREEEGVFPAERIPINKKFPRRGIAQWLRKTLGDLLWLEQGSNVGYKGNLVRQTIKGF